MTHADVERLLVNWAEWMRTGGGVRGYPRSVPGVMVGGNIASWEDLCDSCDKAAARATDASIADMVPPLQMAVHHVHLASHWRPMPIPVEQYYANALAELAELLSAKGLV